MEPILSSSDGIASFTHLKLNEFLSAKEFRARLRTLLIGVNIKVEKDFSHKVQFSPPPVSLNRC